MPPTAPPPFSVSAACLSSHPGPLHAPSAPCLTHTGHAAPPEKRLEQLCTSGLLGLGVPTERGGRGGDVRDLHLAAQALWRHDPATALLLRSQRLAIEALLHARNLGLADYLLPQLLQGERLGTLSLCRNATALQGHDSGRGWRLHGLLPWVPGCGAEGFTLIAPLRLGPATGWATLRGEEDGLDLLPPHWPQPPHLRTGDTLPTNRQRTWARSTGLSDVRCRAFFFREDEWLGDAELGSHLAALDARLRPGSSELTDSLSDLLPLA